MRGSFCQIAESATIVRNNTNNVNTPRHLFQARTVTTERQRLREGHNATNSACSKILNPRQYEV